VLSRLPGLEAPTAVGTVVELPLRPSAGPSDAVLVEAARAGERSAQEALFRRHARMANGLAFRLLGSAQDVDDVVQDAYVIAFDRLHALKDPQAFGSFLGGIIVRRVRRVVRRRRLARRLGLLPESEALDVSVLVAPGASPQVVAELAAVYRLIERLPTDERLALVLRRVEGLSIDEVARACECSPATAKRRIAAAEARLELQTSPAGEAVAPRASGRRS
jgi:RNA polymerase sigma-70 factor, ECF subfamily